MLKWTTGGNVRDRLGEPEGEIEHPSQFRNHASLVIFAKDGMAILQRNYPGWRWAIQLNEFGGVIHVFNHLLHDTWGYLIRTKDFQNQSSRKVFMHAGGELLARFGMPRGRFDYATWKAAPREPKGWLLPCHIDDLRDARSKREVLRQKIARALKEGRSAQYDGRIVVGV